MLGSVRAILVHNFIINLNTTGRAIRIRDVNEMQQTSVMQKIKHEKKGDKYNTVDETDRK